jgi:hypothetical protein
MSSASEFREFARECLDWARTARSEQERAIFMQMAQTWIEPAARLGSAIEKDDIRIPAIADASRQEKANPHDPAIDRKS